MHIERKQVSSADGLVTLRYCGNLAEDALRVSSLCKQKRRQCEIVESRKKEGPDRGKKGRGEEKGVGSRWNRYDHLAQQVSCSLHPPLIRILLQCCNIGSCHQICLYHVSDIPVSLEQLPPPTFDLAKCFLMWTDLCYCPTFTRVL